MSTVRVTYDLRTQPWSLGDLLVFLAVARQKFGHFDLVFLHDPDKRPTDWEFVPRNPVGYLRPLWQVAESIEGCDSIEVSVRPGEWPLDTSKYLFYWLFEQMIEWPVLWCKPRYAKVARRFLEGYGIEGVCHVRRHPQHGVRDSFIPAWDEFFSKLDCKVALIGDVPELARENVIVPDFGVGYQLALVQIAGWYMGASSGPSTMRVFGSGPYRVFNAVAAHVKQFNGTLFTSGPDNEWFYGRETAALLSAQKDVLRGKSK